MSFFKDLSSRWSRRHSYHHVTCAKVDLSSPLGTCRFSRVRVSRLWAFISQRKRPSTIRTLNSFKLRVKRPIFRHEVNDQPTRLALAVMTQEQDKAEGATPHVFSVTDGLPTPINAARPRMAVTDLPKDDIWSVCLRLDTPTQKHTYTSKDERSNKDNCALEAVRAVFGRADGTEMLRNW